MSGLVAWLVLFFSVLRITGAGVCNHSTNGRFFRHQSSNCHYLQCNHGQAMSRRCPSGLGIQPQFTAGHRNPCTMHHQECSRPATPDEVRTMPLDSVQSKKKQVKEGSREGQLDRQREATGTNSQYFKELSSSEHLHPIQSGFVSFGYSDPPEFVQNTQYQQPLEFGANNNFDSSFNYVLESVAADNSPEFSTNQFINPYPFDTSQAYLNGNPSTASGQIQLFSNENQYPPAGGGNNNGHVNQFPQMNQNVPGQTPYYSEQTNPGFQQISNFDGQQHNQHNVQFMQTQPATQPAVFDQTLHLVQAPSVTFQQTPTVQSYHQPQNNQQQVNPVSPSAVYQSQTYQNTGTHTNYQDHPSQAGIVISLPNNKFQQPNGSPYSQLIGGQYVPAVQQEPPASVPVSAVHEAHSLYQQPTAAVQQPIPSGQHTTFTAQAGGPLSAQQKRHALQKLIPFLTRLQPALQTPYTAQHQAYQQQPSGPSNTEHRRTILVKILKRLIQAMKQGVITKPRRIPLRQQNGAPKTPKARGGRSHKHARKRDGGQKPADRPKYQRRQRGRRQRQRGGYRRRNPGIMGKMANGQGGVNINTKGVDVDNTGDLPLDSEGFDSSQDYVSDYEDQEFNNLNGETKDKPQQENNDDQLKIDYTSPGTNAPVTEDSKFRHMRDGIRVPFSKEGTLLYTGVNEGYRPEGVINSKQQQTLQGTQTGRNQIIGNRGQSETNYITQPKTSFTAQSSQQLDLDKDFFSDDVPIEYIDKLRKLAVDYFNDEYDATDNLNTYRDYRTDQEVKQNTNYNYRAENQRQPGYELVEEHSDDSTEHQDMAKSTLPPEPGQADIQQAAFNHPEILQKNTPTVTAIQQRQPKATESRGGSPSPTSENLNSLDQNPLLTDVSSSTNSLKEDIAFQQALTYYSKLLNSLSDFLGEGVVAGEESTEEGEEEVEEEDQASPVELNKKLQNYSYQDLTTEVNVDEYQSNEFTS